MRTAQRIFDLAMLAGPALQAIGARRQVPHVVRLGVLAAIGALLGTMLILGAHYAAYLGLQLAEFSPLQALLITLGIAALLLLVIALLIRRELKALRQRTLPPIEKVHDVIDAFVDGFTRPKGK